LRGVPGEIGGIATARDSLNRMAGEVVDDRERSRVEAIEPEHADLRIDRPHPGDIFVGRHRVCMPNVHLAAVLEPETAVLHDPVLVADSDADPYGNHPFSRLPDRLDRLVIDVPGDDAVAMAGIDHHV